MVNYAYRVIFRITHPTADPAELTSALGMEPNRTWKVGERKKAPNGRELEGIVSESFWSCGDKYLGQDRRFFDEVNRLTLHLKPHKAYLQNLFEAGGKCEIYVQLPGSVNIGDSLAPQTLRLLAELGILLSIEVFPDWEVPEADQSERSKEKDSQAPH
jgi:hypothetical protein